MKNSCIYSIPPNNVVERSFPTKRKTGIIITEYHREPTLWGGNIRLPSHLWIHLFTSKLSYYKIIIKSGGHPTPSHPGQTRNRLQNRHLIEYGHIQNNIFKSRIFLSMENTYTKLHLPLINSKILEEKGAQRAHGAHGAQGGTH